MRTASSSSARDRMLTFDHHSFSMCSLWLIEALARAGQYQPAFLSQAVGLLEVRPSPVPPELRASASG